MHLNNEDLICPYCHCVQHTHEPDDISALMCITECEHCGRIFEYSVEVTRTYYASPYEDPNNDSYDDSAECDEEIDYDDEYYD